MSILLFGLFLFAFSASANAENINLDSLYCCLDEAIAHSPQFVDSRKEHFKELDRQFKKVSTPEERYFIAVKIYKEYKSFDSDSAFHYLDIARKNAFLMGDSAKASQCSAWQSFLASTVGMYAEALEILKNIDVHTLDKEGLGDYYIACQYVYGELAYYSSIPYFRKKYYDTASTYLPLIYSTLPVDNDNYLMRKEMELYDKGYPDSALVVNDRRMSMVKPDSREFAVVAFYRYLDLKAKGDMQMAHYWLIKSAISDVQHGIFDQASLWEIALALSEKGDISRSYRYINFVWNCVRNFGTRMRMGQVAPVLSSIDDIYHERIERSNRKLTALVIAISLVSLLLLLLIFYANSQRKKLAEMRDRLVVSNNLLKETNIRLSSSNNQLSVLNSQLKSVIDQLEESNRVKEEYVGRFLTLCSMYIDRMNNFRTHVNKKLKNHEYESLYKETRPQTSHMQDVEELYQNFDSAFLHLYPNFVEAFNALLRKEERIEVAEAGRLTTSLRIFALIRLGVEDSSRIAEFLHYSVNTIYNYRARTKNGAIADRELFEQHVKAIGMPAKSE